jgi:hypothetical protein
VVVDHELAVMFSGLFDDAPPENGGANESAVNGERTGQGEQKNGKLDKGSGARMQI